MIRVRECGHADRAAGCLSCAVRGGAVLTATRGPARTPPAKALAVLAPPCPHRGAEVVGTSVCAGCGGNGRVVALHACSHFGDRCYTGAYHPKTGRSCMRCPVPNTREEPAVAPAPFDPPRVLFASHELSLTGAPTVLANVLPHLRGVRPFIHCPEDGPLAGRFAEAGVPRAAEIDGSYSLVVANTLVAAPAVRRARDLGLPCVWLIHESDPLLFLSAAELRDLIGYPRWVVFPCRETAAAYPRTRGTVVIPSIVPPAPVRDRDGCRTTLGIDPAAFLVLSFGRADDRRKGHADIRAATEGLAGVQFLAVAGSPDPHSYLAAADLYVCSSTLETYPLSLQEAKAHGLPVITTPVFGCKEIVRDGVDGIHYPPGDVDALRRAIVRVKSDPAEFARPLTHLPSFAGVVARFEDVVRTAAGLPTRSLPLHAVYHVAGMGGHWRQVVAEQLDQLRAAGLGRVLCTHVGEGEDWLIDAAKARGIDLTVCEHHADVKQYECPAIRLIERLVKASDKPVLYLHSKGVTQTEPQFHAWRRLLMRETVHEWRRNLEHLRTHDAVGVNWWTKPGNQHFSGNFWLASAAYLRGRPSIDAVYRDRYSPEVWIGLGNACRAKSLVCTDRAFWDRDKTYLLSLRTS